MNCADLRDLAPLYVSGEIGEELRRQFAAHLNACPACECEIEEQSLLDQRLAQALGSDLPDSSRVEQAVRGRIGLLACSGAKGARSLRRLWVAAAAIAVLAAFLLFPPAPRIYAEAARDHHTEVVEKQPRRWRSTPAEIDAVASQVGLSFARAAALAPAGYRLEHAKICGLDGVRALHLVFTNGAGEYSVYLLPRGTRQPLQLVSRGTEQVAGFGTALVVTAASTANCEELARFTAARL